MSETEQQKLYDLALLRQRRARLETCGRRESFLRDAVAARLEDRLLDVTRDFGTALVSGLALDGHERIDKAHRMELLAMEQDVLPLQAHSLDLIISNLDLHWVNDLPGALIQMRMALKPDGLFLASLFGGETLHELAASLMAAEMQCYGGVSPRISPMIEIKDMGMLLQRGGFNLPVVDTERITVTYPDIMALMRDLRHMGEGNVISARHRQPMSRKLLSLAEEHYRAYHTDDQGRLVASFDILYATAWSPHASQQKPLKPGSAKSSLAEALKGQSDD